MVTTVRTSDRGTAAEVPPSAVAFVLDRDSEGVMRRCFADLGIADAQVSRGGIDAAIEDIGRRGSPQLLVVDVSGVDDPIIMISRLAEVCDPRTEVVVVGERNDIVLYRELKDSGVAEYFFKPLVSSVLVRSLGDAASGEVDRRSARTGKLILVLGVHGGVGTTTIAVQTAWHLAEARERRVLLLDLNLQTGDAALQLDTAPSHALREAFEHPERIDDLFLERGVAKVTPRLGLLAALEPLTEHIMPAEEAALQLLAELLRRYRYVIVDFPWLAALEFPKVLHSPSTVLLVSNASLVSAREVARWRETIGANTPERSTLHVLNKKGADGGLPDAELKRAFASPPDIIIPYDREVARASILGAAAVGKCAAIRRGMAAISRDLAGALPEESRPIWRRIFR